VKDYSPQKLTFVGLTITGFSLLVAGWLISGNTMGFFIILFLVCMMLLRWRIPKTRYTSVLDVLVCVFLAPVSLGVALFAAMYYGMYFAMLAAVYVLLVVDMHLGVIAIFAGVVGFLLRQWEKEREKRLLSRDTEAGRYYQLETLQSDLISATAQIERMTAVSERTRISREIHDNAGHEIVAAYMSLQTARSLFDDADPDALALYDAALERLDAGMNKIRESVHNLASVTSLGIEVLQEICERFPKDIHFKSFGDTRHVPIHIWNVLESCLNEGLTNIGKHANPSTITVELDATPHIVRLCIENDGAFAAKKGMGTGLRNLRRRLVSIGGSLAVASDEIFCVVCVAPIEIRSVQT